MIPVNEPLLSAQELENVAECVRTGWVSSAGRFIREFEERWASYCGRQHGIAVSNGTVALQLALESLDLRSGDEVILPTFTIISCALAVIYAGGTPVLIDSDPDTWCMDVAQIESKITPRTRAIMPVHIYGHPVDMQPLMDLANKHGLTVIEDAAEAHGGEYKDQAGWKRCGSFGAMSCFSFYANKLITTGEGGMLLTDDSKIAERLRSMSNLCFLPKRRFYHEEMGHNFRLTNMQAALGVGQIQRMEEIIQKKRWMAKGYGDRLSGISSIQLPVEKPWARSVYWMYGLVLSDSLAMDAQGLAEKLRQRGVETRPFFLGMHEQPVFHREGLFVKESYPVAQRLAHKGLYLPSGLALTEDQLTRVCDAIHEVLT